jgi:flagellar basal body-associated protein FliL
MADDAKAEPKPEKKGGGISIVGLIVPAILAGGAAFGGAKFGATAPPQKVIVEAPAEPPGPALPIDAFVVTIPDEKGKAHAMRLTIALELKPHAHEEEMKGFVPRIRDAGLSYLRELKFEEVQSPERIERIREDLHQRFDKLGAKQIEHVLITDFVSQ